MQLQPIREFIEAHFNDEELRTLCADLGLDYERLAGSTTPGKMRELIAYHERRGTVRDLLAASCARHARSCSTMPV